MTLLTPFVPPDAIDEALIDQLRRVFASTPAFAVALCRTARFAETVFLAPDPEAPFRTLTRRLGEHWPEHPPYGDPDLDPTPHLTVAHGVGEETLARVEEEVATVLPIEDWAREVLLITGSNEEGWNVRSRFSLGGLGGGRCRQGPV